MVNDGLEPAVGVRQVSTVKGKTFARLMNDVTPGINGCIPKKTNKLSPIKQQVTV